jgi:uncharacterized protein (TIGR02118 family)
MAGAKIVVRYPRPTDATAFEAAYLADSVALAAEKIAGSPSFHFARVVGAAGGEPPYHRVTEIRFPTMGALQRSLADPSTQEAAAHAISLSTGGPPIFLICEDEAAVQS